MWRLWKAMLRRLWNVDRYPSHAGRQERFSWTGAPVAELLQRSPSNPMFDTLTVIQLGNADRISK
jgi:hypothetical protein